MTQLRIWGASVCQDPCAPCEESVISMISVIAIAEIQHVHVIQSHYQHWVLYLFYQSWESMWINMYTACNDLKHLFLSRKVYLLSRLHPLQISSAYLQDGPIDMGCTWLRPFSLHSPSAAASQVKNALLRSLLRDSSSDELCNWAAAWVERGHEGGVCSMFYVYITYILWC